MKTRCTLILLTAITINALAQEVKLDSTFNSVGYITYPVNPFDFDQVNSVALQPDNKIVVAGEYNFTIARYTENGVPDSSFNGTGIVSDSGIAYSVAIQTDGKIIAGGLTAVYPYLLLVKRFNADGSHDTSFHFTATEFFSYAGTNSVSIIIQPDGKIIVAGTISGDLITVRLLPDGTLDTSFNGSGDVITDMYGYNDQATSVAVQADGKIIVGSETNGGTNFRFGLIRYNSDGSIDTSFGTAGKIKTNIGDSHDDFGRSLAIQSDGKILFGGYTYQSATPYVAIARYNADHGGLDPTFGFGGIVQSWVTGCILQAMTIEPAGKIIGVGYKQSDLALFRVNTSGIIDSSFGVNGVVTTLINNVNLQSYGNAIALTSDGKIAVGGYTFENSVKFALIARYLSDFALGLVSFPNKNSTILIYPNPLQQTETLEYTLTKNESLTIALYDVNGKLIKNFISHEQRTAGTHKETLNIGPLPSGNYLLTLSNGSQKLTVKMVKQ